MIDEPPDEEAILTMNTPERLTATAARVLLRTAGTDADALLRLGERLHRGGHPEGALVAFERAVAQLPECLGAWHALAALRFELGRPQAALEAANRALELAPQEATSLFNTAVILAALGQDDAALHCYRRVLSTEPGHAGALRNCGPLLGRLRRLPEALLACGAACDAYPDDAECRFNLGEVCLAVGDYAGALAAFSIACRQQPGCGRFLLAAGVVLAALGEIVAARARMAEALAADSDVLTRFSSPLAADRSSRCPELTPERIAILAGHERLQREGWNRRAEFAALYARLALGENGAPPLDNPDLPYLSLGLPVGDEIRRHVARNTACRLAASVQAARLVRPRRRTDRRLHIGYLSGDVRNHAVAHLMGGLYGWHDRARFKVHLYSTGPDDRSVERLRAEAGAEVFRDLARFGPETVAQAIVRDGVDILIDLSGYTAHGYPAALALRPAPVQASYVGFMGAQGAAWIDYALLDREVLLPEVRAFWDERIAYLPHCFTLCERPVPAAAPQPSRRAVGLPEQALVFCSFNMPRKIEPESFALWMRVLKAVPGTVLWLIEQDPAFSDFLRAAAVEQGVAAERLVFAPLLNRAEHLARYRLADLFLDSLAYNSHATCADALGMGVPLLTCPGREVVARVAASMLRAHGLPDLVAASAEEYVVMAARFAEDDAWRQDVRQRAAVLTATGLFCPEKRVRDLERAYVAMWERHTAGLPPADFDVPLLNP